ncbi:MAG TPA: DPP IV N-terminal domain-containing protein [Polyangiales bacterium]|nr:DPP IV N-terminal domain-containing protein [Polyangiales bacterium]
MLSRIFWGLPVLLLVACHREPPKKTPPPFVPPPPSAAMPEAWPAIDESFLDAYAATQGFRLGKPAPLAITADGAVLFRRTGARERRADLHVLELDGTERTIDVDTLLGGQRENLSSDEQARRERTRTATGGVVDVDVSRDGNRIAIPLGERVFVFDRKRGDSREASIGAGYPYDPRLSPDGKTLSFVRDGDLWTVPVDGGTARKITSHDKEIEYGIAEFVAQEEFDRTRGYWWSPDSQTIAFQRTDARQVETIYVSDARRPERKPTPFKYPKPGENNADVQLGLQSIHGGAPRWVIWDRARWPYLAKVEWSERGPLTLLVFDRAQSELAMLAVDPNGATRVLVQANDPTWVNLAGGSPIWLEHDAGFLWMAEAADGWTLEHYSSKGEHVRTLLKQDFGLRAIAGIEPDESAIVLASPDPREQHVWRVLLDGSAPIALTTGSGFHHAIAAHGVTVITSALHEGGASVNAIYPDGRRQQLPSVAEHANLTPTTQLESIEVEGRTMYSAITRPRNFDANKHYPVLLKVYGGPHVTTVLDYLDGYLLDQWYADAGFIVVRADGRGTPNRGHDWERAIYKDVITIPLHDQVAALEAMETRHPEMDRARVGVFGWSFGGWLSTMGILLRPDVFKAAVAGAPVTDPALYDSAYTERYLQTPQQNPDGYREDSALTHASKLERPLLIIHGVTDDNVHFAHTLALIEALFQAGKRAEVVALSSTHMLADPQSNRAREQMQVDFFRDHLASAAPQR